MSLAQFQHAVARLIADAPFRWAVAAGDDDALGAYALDEREKRRLASLAAQRGLVVGEMIYRLNRALALSRFLPLTLAALGTNLKREIELFWTAWPHSRLQFEEDVTRFGEFLGSRLSAGAGFDAREGGAIADVLGFELALAKLGFASTAAAAPQRKGVDPRVAVLSFRRHPERLLGALRRSGRLAAELPSDGEHYRLLDGRRTEVRLRRLGRRTGRLIAALQAGGVPGAAAPRHLALLRRAGILAAPDA